MVGSSNGRAVRVLVTLAMLPALLLTQQAFLIHDHQGHDIHCHPIALKALDDWERGSEHRHDDHEHDGEPADPPAEGGSTVVIVLGIPDAAPGLRALSRTTVVGAASAPPLQPMVILADGPAHRRSANDISASLAPNLRADDRVTSILLTSHALLL